MEDFNWSLLLPLILLNFLLALVALIDLWRREVSRVRWERKWVWVLTVLFVQPFGAIAYFVLGRKEG